MYLAHICLNKCHKNTYKNLRLSKWHTYTRGDMKKGDVELTIRVAATKEPCSKTSQRNRIKS